jgi:uncharacterized protein (TIGR03435 family)
MERHRTGKASTMRAILLGLTVVAPGATLLAQQPAIVGARFDVVSIKLHKSDQPGGGMRREPDGTQIMTNVTVRQFIMAAATERVVDVVGLPDWATLEHYDVIAKPAPGSRPTTEQQAEMMRNLFAERMKLVAHLAEEDRTTFALVLARSDGRLGPNLKKSEADCAAQAAQALNGRPPGRRQTSCTPAACAWAAARSSRVASSSIGSFCRCGVSQEVS